MRFILPAAAGLAIFAASLAQAQTVGIGTNPQGSIAFAAGSAIGKMLTEKSDIRARVVPQGGPDVLIPLTLQGEFDFTFANTVAANFAYNGGDTFKEPLKDLRAVVAVFPLRIGFFVRKDSNINALSDLRGKRVAWGYPQQSNLQSFTETFLMAGGLTEKDVQTVPVPSGTRAMADFKEGKVDVAVFSLTAGLSKETDAAVGGIRTVPYPQDERGKAAIDKHSPGAVVEVVKPGPAFAGVPEPTGVISTPLVLLTGAKQKDDLVRKVTTAMLDNAEALGQALPALRGFDPKNPAPTFGVPYHPAALAVYKERGLIK